MMLTIKNIIKRTPLIYIYIYLKHIFLNPRSQTDEAMILDKLIRRFKVSHCFVEFGFSGWEFNCANLVSEWDGLLLDGDPYNVKIAKTICPKNVVAINVWLTLDNVNLITEYAKTHDIGVLSVDVDGNDYWFMKSIININASIIIVEYNSSFCLHPVTVPYDPCFDRKEKHESWTYFGASLVAMHKLMTKYGYSLIEVSNNGVNAFFVRKNLLTPDDYELNPENAFREKYFPDGSRPSQQWERIKHLPFVDVTEL